MASRNPYPSQVVQTPEYSSFSNIPEANTTVTPPVLNNPRAGNSLLGSSSNQNLTSTTTHTSSTPPSRKSSRSFSSNHKSETSHKVQNAHGISRNGDGDDESILMSDSDSEDDEYDPLHQRASRRGRTRIGRLVRTVRKRMHRALEWSKEITKANTGLLLITGSQAFFSIMNTAVKVLNGIDPPMGALQLVWVRMVITYICCITYMLAAGVPDPFLGPKGVRLLLVCRGFFGYFGLFGIYYSLQYLTLSDATVLTFLAPITTGIAGALLLGETFTKRQALAGLISLAGVVLIARPAALFGSSDRPDPGEKGTSSERMVAVGVALVGVLGATGAYTSIRAIGTRAHPMHSMTFFSLLCIIVSTLSMIFAPSAAPIVIPTRLLWVGLLLMIGLVGFVAQLLLTMGLQKETAGRGALAIYSQIVFASILQMVFFDEIMGAWSIVGTVMIVGAAAWVAVPHKGNSEKDDEEIVADSTSCSS
ncbi:hypothetical protein CVT24_005464 [Panaeolus cyanescens]|uniref:EamA domain-containing protein n=1 Tax=Panaeolus cyanescens TaxID=181874 RepID=A0A409YC20_9AGAR|nr:hypothetical protein CVT24_005464 [Panaeolus cyanescens]